MRPPICELCGGKAEATVRFADHEPLPDGMTGHPHGLEWFCRRHLRAAQALRHEPTGAALRTLRARRRNRGLAVHALLVAASAALAIRGHAPGAAPWLVWVFKPLTTVLVLLLAVRPRRGDVAAYRNPIALGLVFALAGDVLLMPSIDLFLAGLASFGLTHVCYLVAFRSDVRFAPRRLPFAVAGGVAAAVMIVLWPGLDPGLVAPVLLYAALLAAMTAQAAGRAAELATIGTRVAALGALLFLASDSALAVDRFRFPFEAARAVVLSTYFAAQWLIALSAELYHSER